MKYFLFLFISLVFITDSEAQIVVKDTVKSVSNFSQYDSIANIPIALEEVYVSNRYNFKSDEERKQFQLLKRRVIKVYPYAKMAADRLTALNNGMKGLKTEKEKRKYFKLVENYLTTEFEGQLKKLSRKEGQILVKLIHRQTGISTFDLIKELKSGWKAFWSNNTARLFDINLKTKYNPYDISEDFIIESILFKAFNEGRLTQQVSKVDMKYEELSKLWKEKLKALRAAKE